MDFGNNNKMFLYLSLGDKAANMEYMYDLKESIDEDILKGAVADALKAFPFFCLKPYISAEGRLAACDNDAKVPVHKADGKKVRLGTKDTNGYLFRVTYLDNRITVIASHGIGDGRGISSFAQTVVYYYLTAKGYSIDTQGLIYTIEDAGDPAIRDILTEKVKSIDFKREGAATPENIEFFSPPDAKVYFGTPDTRQFRIIWEQDKFIKTVKSMGGTPLVFVHTIIAKAMYRYYNLTDENIIANVPVDLRERLKSRAQSNFTTNVNLVITPEDLKMDMSSLMSLLRDRLKAATDLDKMLNDIANFSFIYDYLDQITFEDETGLNAFAEQITKKPPVRTYLLSNIGAVKLPKDMVPLVDNVDISFTNLESTPVFTLLTYENRGTLIIGQNYEDNGFIRVLQDVFDEHGVKTTLSDCGLIRSDAVNIMDFERQERLND